MGGTTNEFCGAACCHDPDVVVDEAFWGVVVVKDMNRVMDEAVRSCVIVP